MPLTNHLPSPPLGAVLRRIQRMIEFQSGSSLLAPGNLGCREHLAAAEDDLTTFLRWIVAGDLHAFARQVADSHDLSAVHRDDGCLEDNALADVPPWSFSHPGALPKGQLASSSLRERQLA